MPAAPRSTPSGSASTSPPASAACGRLLDAWDTLREKGPRRVMPMTVPMLMPNAAAAAVSMHLGARAYARTVASACASSTESIVNAVEHLRLGLADVVIAGGSESAIHPITIAVVRVDAGAVEAQRRPRARHRAPTASTATASSWAKARPLSSSRREEHASARGAKIYAAVVGGGVTADSYHITAPEPEGLGASRAVRLALEQAGSIASTTSRTSTRTPRRPRPATSPSTRRCSASSATASTRSRSRRRRRPRPPARRHRSARGRSSRSSRCVTVRRRPTINVSTQDPEIPLRISGSPMPLGDGPQLAISNSFGFGGHNAVAAFTLGLTAPAHTKTPPGSHAGASVVSGGDSRSRRPGFIVSEHR